MSEWITDRKPTEEDCKGVLGTAYESRVWVNDLDTVVTSYCFHVEAGVAWHPIVIEKPEPYVAPKRYEVKSPESVGLVAPAGYLCVYDTFLGCKVTSWLPTREAAERIAAIYNEVMP